MIAMVLRHIISPSRRLNTHSPHTNTPRRSPTKRKSDRKSRTARRSGHIPNRARIASMSPSSSTGTAILSSPRIRPPSRSSLPTPSTPTRTVIHTHIHTNSPSIHRTSCETAVTWCRRMKKPSAARPTKLMEESHSGGREGAVLLWNVYR